MRHKVYCIDCKHYDGGGSCLAPRNMREIGTWLKIKVVPIDLPAFRNRNNDCKDFEGVRSERKRLSKKDKGKHDRTRNMVS